MLLSLISILLARSITSLGVRSLNQATSTWIPRLQGLFVLGSLRSLRKTGFIIFPLTSSTLSRLLDFGCDNTLTHLPSAVQAAFSSSSADLYAKNGLPVRLS